MRVGQAVTFTTAFTDPGLLDTYEVTIAWDTGVTETFSLSGGTRQFTLEHAFTRPDRYQITVSIRDDDGGISSVSFEIVVNPWSIFLPIMRKY